MVTISYPTAKTVSLFHADNVVCNLALSEPLTRLHPEVAPRVLEMLQDQIPGAWEHLAEQVADHPIIKLVQSSQPPDVDFTVVLISNEEIRELNARFRQKDEPTDVLSFPLVEMDQQEVDWSKLPVIDLGEIYISLEWATSALSVDQTDSLKFYQDLSLYILERLIHGCLHLLGVHHETLSAYNKVVAIQKSVIDNIL